MTDSGLRRYPRLYEINTCLFTQRMSQKYERNLTLMAVPDEEWQELAQLGFDLIWLMGVWRRSQGSRQEALKHPELRQEYSRTLPDWTEEDIGGSPYAIPAYELNPSLGKPDELGQLKAKLNRLGLRLILDFVPNHLALDHPWIWSHPERFVQRETLEGLMYPDWFFAPAPNRNFASTRYFAHGRDPNFPPWTDTVQVNFYSPDLRQALVNELKKVARAADGVRCDMAMLALNDVFQGVWGKFTDYPRPLTEFWTEAIGQVKQERPDFLFLGEAYWNMEKQLQQLGFDFTYDKTLYDRLRFSKNGDIRGHLMDKSYQQRSIHFIENHDEQRAITAFGHERSLAAAMVMSTVPGVRLFHAGQLEGCRIRIPVQMMRGPEEAADPDIRRFYQRLLTVCNSPAFHEGEWELLDFDQDGLSNNNHPNVLTWYWQHQGQLKVVVVNYSQENSAGWLTLPVTSESKENITLREELRGRTETFSLKKAESQKLYLKLKPWDSQILDVDG